MLTNTPMSRNLYRIGELAARCGVSTDTIRFYEREGLLPPPKRTPSRYRVYGEADASRLMFIRDAQSIGLTLSDIAELIQQERLHTPDECSRVASVLRQRIGTIDRKLGRLRALRRRLARSLRQCETADSDSCPVILDLSGAHGSGKGIWNGEG